MISSSADVEELISNHTLHHGELESMILRKGSIEILPYQSKVFINGIEKLKCI